MSEDLQIIHRLLDGEVSEKEKTDILNKMDSDPALRHEFYDIEKTIQRLENSAPLIPPASFTSDVMRKLPASGDSYIKRLWNFLFKDRMLQWNIATAVATVCIVLVVIAGISRIQKRHDLPVSKEEAMSTVTINFYAPDAKTVTIAGDFNRWDTDDRIMKKMDNGIWTIELPLKTGTYNYMFVVDGGIWVTDPNAGAYRDDGFGYKNSVLRVSAI